MRIQIRLAAIVFCSLAAILVLPSLSIPTFAQQGVSPQAHVPYDWSHHRLVFSNPGSAEEALRNGMYQQWLRAVTQPRFAMQQAQRTRMRTLPIEDGSEGLAMDSQYIETQGPLPIIRKHADWSMDMGSGAKVGAGQYPAKFSFSIDRDFCDSASQPDFVVYNTGLAGSGTQPSIIAYDNLYSGCTGSIPLVYWQYNTNGGTVPTSVTLSYAGDQVAFIQTSSSVASLVIMKWAKNSSLVSLTNTAAASYRACPAPCMTALTLNGSHNSTNSSPFYDYANDVLYVGDNSGVLHKFTGIFFGTPAEITGGGTTSGWPQTITSGVVLTSSIYDSTSGSVFVATPTVLAHIPGGGSGTGGGSNNIVKSGTLGSGIVDAPLVDSTAARVYVTVPNDGSTACGTPPTACMGVYQLTTSFTGGKGSEVTVGSAETGLVVYDGTFDNDYYNSNSSSPTGNLWICGNGTMFVTAAPHLWQVPITANIMGTPLETAQVAATGSNPACSPVTEFFNNAVDQIFLSVQGNGNPTGCAGGGCVMAFPVTQWQTRTQYAALAAILDSNGNVEIAGIAGGTSGITEPTWDPNIAGITFDNGVRWTNQGPLQVNDYATWFFGRHHTVGQEIIDSNGNIQAVTVAGTSGTTTPHWATLIDGMTLDGTVMWTHVGPPVSSALATAGGASAIIIDNDLSSPTGASQTYFSTLSNQACTGNGTTGSGTGGCAIQASQANLQ